MVKRRDIEHIIFTSCDSNMAGYEWSWTLGLRRTARNGYTLHIKNTTSDKQYGAVRVPAVKGIRTGPRLYEAVAAALQFADIEFDDQLAKEITKAISSFDANLARQFKEAPKAIEALEEAQKQRRTAARKAALQPFRTQIDAYLENISDRPIKNPGGGTYGNKRGWLKLFIENYVLTHGALPEGFHRIVVQGNSSYFGGTHDFGDFCSKAEPSK